MSQTRTAIDRLILERVSQTMTAGGFSGAITNLSSQEAIRKNFADARAFVTEAIATVRTAPDADPKWTDEEIAAKIMKGVDERKPVWSRNAK